MASAKWTAKYLSFPWGIAVRVALHPEQRVRGEAIPASIGTGRRHM